MSIFLSHYYAAVSHLGEDQKGKSCLLLPTRSVGENRSDGERHKVGAGSRATSSRCPRSTRVAAPRREAPKGLNTAHGSGAQGHRPFPASPPRMPQAPSQFPHLARLRPAPFPNDCPAPFLTELCAGQRKGGEGGKDGPRGTLGSVVQEFHSAIFFRSGGGQRGSRDYDSQPPFRFVFVQKKKNPTLPLLTLHTHSHTPTADTHTPGCRRESRVSPSRPAASPVLASQ